MRSLARSTFLLPVLVLILSACGASSTPAATTPTLSTGSDASAVSRDTRVLRTHSYIPDYHVTSRLSDGSTLYVFHSMCAGSVDGHCQAVTVFRDGASTPIWQKQYVGVRGLRAMLDGFAVTAVNYDRADPLCCPSLPDVTDSFTWKGSRFVEHGPAPHEPGA